MIEPADASTRLRQGDGSTGCCRGGEDRLDKPTTRGGWSHGAIIGLALVDVDIFIPFRPLTQRVDLDYPTYRPQTIGSRMKMKSSVMIQKAFAAGRVTKLRLKPTSNG